MKKFTCLLIILLSIKSYSQDSGWEVVESGTNQDINSVYFFDHQFGFAVGNSGVILKSIDGGKTWQTLQSLTNLSINDVYMFSTNCFIAVCDSGKVIGTWNDSTWYVADVWPGVVENIYSVSFSGNQNYSPGLFAASLQTIIIGLSTFCTTVTFDAYGGSPGGFWAAFMLSEELGFVAGENSFAQPILGRTTDSGSSWDYVSFYLDGNEGRATGISFTDSLNGFISAVVSDGRGAIANSIDNGDSWSTKFFTSPLQSLNFPASNTGQIGYSVGDSGTILKTTDAGENWYPQLSGVNQNLKKVFFVDENLGFIVGENGLILRTINGGGIILSNEDEMPNPIKFALIQNYPNPFNPATKIQINISEPGVVSLKVYDILGNEITTLVNEEKPVGEYEVEFTAKDLSSGIYFYKLQAGSFIQTRKMVLLK